MSSANGTTGASGQGMPRRPAGGPRKPVVPVIPLHYLQTQRRNPPNAVNGKSRSNEQAAPKELAHSTSDVAQAQPSGPDRVTQPATTSNTAPVAINASDNPPAASSSRKGTDTPIAHASAAHAQQPVASPIPTRRHVAPPFHAVNGSQHQLPGPQGPGGFPQSVTDHGAAPSMNQTRQHRTHPSNGSLVFGALHDSSSSSPAPLGGGAQPPSSLLYISEGTAPPGLDGFGQPFLGSPGFDGFPLDGFPPPVFPHSRNHHGPPTPHSFHGSQSSTHADENGYAPYGAANGNHGPPPLSATHSQNHVAGMSLGLQSGPPYSVPSGPGPACVISRPQAQILDFLRREFERAEFPDCTLEFHLPGSHRPLVIPCHRFVISQSPMLHRILRTRDVQAGGRVVLEVQDQYMRSDSIGFTLRTLYGWDLGDGPLPPYHPQQGVKEGFDVSLSYISCAAYLELPFVYAKGIHHACHQLHWETVEKACEFALPRTVFGGQPARRAIPASSPAFAPLALIDAIKAFLVHNMPADFVLDVNVDDCGFSRLPRTTTSGASDRAGGANAQDTPGFLQEAQSDRRGSPAHAHMPRTSRLSTNPRLSSIQFGDMSLANGQQGAPKVQKDGAGPRSPSPVDTILSRILLNLPFPVLKQVLEHPGLAKPSGDLNPAERLKLISSLVAEREARRAATLSSGDAQVRVFVEALGNASEPLVVQEMGDFLVNSMGFKEEVFPGDVPYLVQTWVHGSGSASS